METHRDYISTATRARLANSAISRSPLPAPPTCQGGPQALRFDPPIRVFAAVEQDHGNPVAVLVSEVRRPINIDFVPGDPLLRSDSSEDRTRVVTQMAAGPADQG
jgi:hypothetical protein